MHQNYPSALPVSAVCKILDSLTCDKMGPYNANTNFAVSMIDAEESFILSAKSVTEALMIWGMNLMMAFKGWFRGWCQLYRFSRC
jgi:hypothetical protein